MNIYCVLVTYNPNLSRLRLSCESIISNGAHLIVVDNGSSNSDAIADVLNFPRGAVRVIFNEFNMGISAAQNVGISDSIGLGADYVWLSDQDTIYGEKYLESMLSHIKLLRSDFACIGPVYVDGNRGEKQPLVKFSPFTIKFEARPGINEVAHIIASGMLIPIAALKTVGLMQENLFIDWVDMEWCWRAKKCFNLKTYVNGDVVIDHVLGDSYKSIFSKKIVLRSPFRHYHMVRNALYLAIYSDSLYWNQRVELVCKALVWAVLFPSLADKKREHLRATLKGVFHGILGRLDAVY